MIDVEKYLTVPYVKSGRSMDGLDCWGLTLAIRAELGAPDLESAPEVNRDGPQGMQRLYQRLTGGPLVQDCDVKPGMIAAVFRASVLVHVAVALEIDGRIALLETNPSSGVRWMYLDRFLHTYYKVAFYRDRDFSEQA